MEILIIGANGQLGWELLNRSKPRNFDTVSLDLPEFDITDRSQVQKQVLQANVSLVINAAAHTAVDRAESEAELAFGINRDGPSHLASACAEKSIPLIHISTDYVFDGRKKTPYSEGDPVCPLGVYGKSKEGGEVSVRDLLQEHIILRTSWLYGTHGNNFVKTMIHLGGQQEQVRVIADQYGSPTYTGDLADAILDIAALIRKGGPIAWGTYHYCGKGETTWHGFAEKIFELAGQYVSLKVKKVEAITTEDYPTPAKRPAWSCLDCSSIETQFHISPRPWQEGLEEMIWRMFNTQHENNSL
jgi:dTDP-4-dehydrorhamnose reductase